MGDNFGLGTLKSSEKAQDRLINMFKQVKDTTKRYIKERDIMLSRYIKGKES